MGSIQKSQTSDVASDEEGFLMGKSPASLTVLIMSLKTAFELELFDLISKAHSSSSSSLDDDGHLSAAEIASLLPTQNPQAPAMLDRMLRLLANASFLHCKLVTDEEDGNNNNNNKRLYKLAPLGRLLVKNEDGISHAQEVELCWDKVLMDSWGCLKDAILEGGVAFNRAHDGMNAFEYAAKDKRFNELLNNTMSGMTSVTINRLLEVYHGFEGVQVLVDVGGGLGTTMAAIVSKYPDIRGINFDLPHVIQNAPPLTGVEHMAGDMFESVPVAKMIILKYILHDWSDDLCLKILNNCFKALPKAGKLIVIEKILPENPAGVSSDEFHFDVVMLVINPGGKERTHKEWELLAKGAGFASIKPVCRAYNNWLIEFCTE